MHKRLLILLTLTLNLTKLCRMGTKRIWPCQTAVPVTSSDSTRMAFGGRWTGCHPRWASKGWPDTEEGGRGARSTRGTRGSGVARHRGGR